MRTGVALDRTREKVIREKHKEKQERGERRNDERERKRNVNDDGGEDVVSVALDVNREMVSFAIERASEAKAVRTTPNRFWMPWT